MDAACKHAYIPDQIIFIERCFEGPILPIEAEYVAIPSLVAFFVLFLFRSRKKELAAKQAGGWIISRLASNDNYMPLCVFRFEFLDGHDPDVALWVIGLDLPV